MLFRSPQDEVRVENLGELENVAREFEQQFEQGVDENGETLPDIDGGARRRATLSDFLERVSLVADSDEIPDGQVHGGVVTLMTVHTAKGLEFPVVFVTGMEDSVFPHARALSSARELEEERRLAYVAMTRAMQRLYLTRAAARSTWGQPNYNPESRFLAEIPEQYVDRRGEQTTPMGVAVTSGGPSRPTARAEVQVMQLSVGDRVLHDKFGMGTVVATQGAGEKAEATIDFKSAGQKRLLLRYAPVEKL